MTDVQYHAALFAFLGETPHRPAHAVTAVTAWEAKHSLKLPAAVREWYELDGPALWRKYLPRDYVPELTENPPLQLLKVEDGISESGELAHATLLADPRDTRLQVVEAVDPRRYLVLSMETDCGIKAIVCLDDTVDPSMALYGEGHEPDTGNFGAFSTWIFDAFFDDASMVVDASHHRLFPIMVTAKDELPSEDDLRALRTAFHSGPVGVGGIGWTYRFYDDGNFVLIGKSPYYDDSDWRTWEIRSRSAADLCNTLAILWPLANLRRKLVLERGDENLHRIMESTRHFEGSRDEIASEWRKMATVFSKK
jgi:hypothetical protein